MLGITYAIISAFFNACNKTLFRSMMRVQGDPWAILILYNFGAAFILLALLGLPDLRVLSPWALLLLLCGGVFWSLAGYFDLRSHEHLDVALHGLFGSLRYVVLSIACVFIFGEKITLFGIVGIALVVFSVWLNTDLASTTFRRGSFFRLMSIIFINLGTINDKYLTSFVDPSTVALMAFILPGFMYTCCRPKKFLLIAKEVKKSQGKLLLAPILSAIVYYTYVLSFTHGDLMITSTIGQTTTVFAYLFGIVLLRERRYLLNRAIASILCVVGAVLVSLKI